MRVEKKNINLLSTVFRRLSYARYRDPQTLIIIIFTRHNNNNTRLRVPGDGVVIMKKKKREN